MPITCHFEKLFLRNDSSIFNVLLKFHIFSNYNESMQTDFFPSIQDMFVVQFSYSFTFSIPILQVSKLILFQKYLYSDIIQFCFISTRKSAVYSINFCLDISCLLYVQFFFFFFNSKSITKHFNFKNKNVQDINSINT